MVRDAPDIPSARAVMPTDLRCGGAAARQNSCPASHNWCIAGNHRKDIDHDGVRIPRISVS
jgi:hypothetical protein